MATATTTEMKIEHIDLAKIVPTKDNPRTIRKTDPKLKELADSIAKHGVLEPVIGRPHPKKEGHIDLRAGERRYHASKMAGNETIPIIVREMTDDEAFEITITENMQREDLHPLEEASGIQKMIDHGWTLDQAASQLGKSKAWIARRAQLSKLSSDWKEAVSDPESDASEWPAANLELVARLPESMQAMLLEEFDHFGGVPSLQEIRSWTANQVQVLATAPWKLDDESLLPKAGSCADCPKRSDCQSELFDDNEFGEVKGRKGKKQMSQARCLDPECWEAKHDAHIKIRAAELKDQYPNLVIVEAVPYGDKHQWPNSKDAHTIYQFADCKKSDDGAFPCLWVNGFQKGRLEWKRAHKSVGGSSASSAKDGKGKTVKEKREDLERLRRRIVIRKLLDLLEDVVEKDAFSPNGTMTNEDRIAFVATFGTDFRSNSVHYPEMEIGKNYSKWSKAQFHEVVDRLFLSSLAVLVDRWRTSYGYDSIPAGEETFICDLLGIDLNSFWKEARAEKPEPKSWAKQEEAEKAKPKKAAKKKAASKGKG